MASHNHDHQDNSRNNNHRNPSFSFARRGTLQHASHRRPTGASVRAGDQLGAEAPPTSPTHKRRPPT
eukprot:15479238-Alexandrium_andersonii.AAC.1